MGRVHMIEPASADAAINHYPEFDPIQSLAMDAETSFSNYRQPAGPNPRKNRPSQAAAPRPPAKTRRRLPRPNGALLVLAAASFAIMAALGLREKAVRAVPSLARVYAAIGLPVNLRGLEIRGLKSSLQQDASGSVLAVEGEIVNIRPSTVAVPQVRIGVEGADGQEIYTWTTAVPKARLAEGETIDFRARLTTPPKDAHAVLVKFAAAPE